MIFTEKSYNNQMLEINDVSYSYDQSKLVLENISVNFDRGITGLIGKNGSGKSTLLKLMSTILTPQKGSIKWENNDIHKTQRSYLSQLGYVPQDVPVFEELTVQEYLNYFSAYKGLDYRKSKRRINELMTYFNLESYRNTRTHKLSGGTLRRVAICNCLLTDPKIWILDEPMNGLDISERNNFKQLLANYANDKLVIISSHILSDIELLASKAVFLNQGKHTVSGTTSELVSNLSGKVWSAKIRDLSEVSQLKLSALQITPSEGCYSVRYISETPILNNAILESANLEDVYLHLVQNEEARYV